MSDGKTVNEGNEGSKYKDKNFIRVTTALGILDKGEGFKHWLIKFKTYEDMVKELTASAERGSKVDDIIKRLSVGEKVPRDESVAPFIEAYKKWTTEWRFNCMQRDKEVYDEKMGYVGTLDLFGELSNKGAFGKMVVIDIKTGVPGRDKVGNLRYDIHDSMHYQTAAYRHAVPECLGIKCEENWILRLFSDGNYKFEQDMNYKLSFEVFSHALAIAKLKKYGLPIKTTGTRKTAGGAGGYSQEDAPGARLIS